MPTVNQHRLLVMLLAKSAAISAIALGAILLPQLLSAGEDASLQQAMKDLQNELDNFKVDTSTLLIDGQTTPHTETIEYSNVIASAHDCSIQIHQKITSSGKVAMDRDSNLDLRTLRTFDVVYEARLEVPGAVGGKFLPPTFHLRVWGSTSFNLHFADAKTAERVRSKFARSVELCNRRSGQP